MLTGTLNPPIYVISMKTIGVENENSEEYFCFEEKQDKISIMEWRNFTSEAPVAQWTSVLDF